MIRVPHAFPTSIRLLTTAHGGDGRWLILTAAGGEFRCWPADATAPETPLIGGTNMLLGMKSFALAELPDGTQIVVVQFMRSLKLWDVATGQWLGKAVGDVSLMTRPGLIAATGEIVITNVAGGGLRRWNAGSGTVIGDTFGVAAGPVTALASSTMPDGTAVVVSGGKDGLVHRWDPRTGTEIGEPVRGCGQAVSMTVAASVICVLSAKGDLHRRDLVTGEPVGEPVMIGWQVLPRRGMPGRVIRFGTVTAVATSATDGVIASRSGVHSPVLLWDLRTGEPRGTLEAPDAHLAPAKLADGTPLIVAGGDDGIVRRFDARTGTQIGEPMYPHGHRAYRAVPVSMPDGRLVILADGRCFDASTGSALDVLVKIGDYGLAVAALADGRVIAVAGNEDGIARMDLVSGAVYPPSDDEKPFTIWDVAMATVPDGRVIIGGAGHNWLFYRWDAATGDPIGEPLPGHMISVKSVTTARQRDGSPMFITGCEKGDVIRWDAVTGERVGQRIVADDDIEELEVVERPGGGQLLVGLGEFLHRWDPVTGNRVGRPVRVARFSHLATVYADRAGTPFALLVTHDDGDEQLWRLDAGERVDDVRAGLRAVLPDGRRVVAEADGSLVIGG